MLASAYTLEEARSNLAIWKTCIYELGEGQAKSYRIGSREFTTFDLDEVMRMVNFFSNLVESLSGNVRNTRVARVVLRDL